MSPGVYMIMQEIKDGGIPKVILDENIQDDESAIKEAELLLKGWSWPTGGYYLIHSSDFSKRIWEKTK